MKRILFIAPHSFPVSSSESICNSKVAFALAKSGYKVDVYTCVDPYSYPSTSELDSVLKDSENLRIVSVPKKDVIKRNGGTFVSQLKAIIKHLYILLKSGYFYNGITLPYDIIKAIEKDTKGLKQFPYDVMITRGFLTDYAGIYFAKKTGVKWIANWNDPYPEEKFPYPYGNGSDAKLHFLKQRVFNDIQKYASLHTFPNNRLRDYMLTCFKMVPQKRTCVIPHMALSKLSPRSRGKDQSVLNIVSCGNVKKPRSIEFFLQALSAVLSDDNYGGIKVKCEFIGSFDANAQIQIDRYHLQNIVKLIPPKTYDECNVVISEASVSLIIEAICEEGIYLPTKVVDAIQCGTPILCISPTPGVLDDLIKNNKVGYFAKNSDVNSIVETLKEVIDDFRMHNLPIVEKESAPMFFEEAIVEQYNRIL